MASEPNWVSEEELELFARQPTPSQRKANDEQLAMRIFRDNLPLAAEMICHLATSGEKESTRLNASKYVVERVLGRVGDMRPETEGDIWDGLFGSVVREPTAEERASGSRVSRL